MRDTISCSVHVIGASKGEYSRKIHEDDESVVSFGILPGYKRGEDR